MPFSSVNSPPRQSSSEPMLDLSAGSATTWRPNGAGRGHRRLRTRLVERTRDGVVSGRADGEVVAAAGLRRHRRDQQAVRPDGGSDHLLIGSGGETGRRDGGPAAGSGARPAMARSRCPCHADILGRAGCEDVPAIRAAASAHVDEGSAAASRSRSWSMTMIVAPAPSSRSNTPAAPLRLRPG
jgi:hypothetical protein